MKNLDFTPIHNLPNGGLLNTELDNGEHLIIRCRKCNKSLADLWITKPKAKIVSIVTAKCDYCGDQSFKTTVNGGFHTGVTEESLHKDIIFNKSEVDENGCLNQEMTIITCRS